MSSNNQNLISKSLATNPQSNESGTENTGYASSSMSLPHDSSFPVDSFVESHKKRRLSISSESSCSETNEFDVSHKETEANSTASGVDKSRS